MTRIRRGSAPKTHPLLRQRAVQTRFSTWKLPLLGFSASLLWSPLAFSQTSVALNETISTAATNNALPPLPQELPREAPLKLPEFLRQGNDGQLILPPVEELGAVTPELATPTSPLRAVRFQGNRVFTSEELLAQVQKFIGSKVTPEQIEEMRLALTRYYVDRGYINSGALVSAPPDESGTLNFEIVEGRVSAVVVHGNEDLNERYITSRLGIDQSVAFNVEALKRNMPRVYSDPLIKQINIQVLPGVNRGEAIVDTSIVRARPWSAFVATDNYRSPSVGETEVTVGGDYRNLTGQGDQLSMRASRPTKSGYRVGLDFYMPLGYWGTNAHLGYNIGASTTQEGDYAGMFSNRSTDQEIGLSQQLYESLTNGVSVDVAQVNRQSEEMLSGSPYPFESGLGDPSLGNVQPAKVKVNRISLNLSNRGQRHAISARLSYNKGSSNYTYTASEEALNARSQLFAVPNFNYLLWQLQAVYQINDRNDQVALRASGQKTTQHLPGLERFSLGGSHSVRGFREGLYSADNGSTVTLEAQINLPEMGDVRTRIIPFYDMGSASKVSTQENGNKAKLSSYGLGLEFRYHSLTARLDWAKQAKAEGVASYSSGALQDKGISFSLRWDF